MSQQELLIRAVQALTAAGINYMLTGSLASSLQGEPRLSHDIDLAGHCLLQLLLLSRSGQKEQEGTPPLARVWLSGHVGSPWLL